MSIAVTLANLATLATYAAILFVGVNMADKYYFVNEGYPGFDKYAGFVRKFVLMHGFLLGFVLVITFKQRIFVHPFSAIATAVFAGFAIGWLLEYGMLYSFGVSRILLSSKE